MIFDEKDVRRFYQWLGHRPDEFTEIRVITWPPGQATPYFMQNEDDFVKVCKEWNGKRQVYTGINPRKQKGGTAEDVVRVTGIPFDVDSDHDPEVACTDQELEKAKERCIQLNSLLITQGYKNPYIDMSGNGYRVALRVNIPITEDLYGKLISFFHETNDALPFSMDSIFDLSRIIKVPGTMSIKGIPTEERPHRLSRILTIGNNKPDEILKKHIEGLGSYSPPIVSTFNQIKSKSRSIYRSNKLRPCFQRFVDEGGRLSTNEYSDNPVTEKELRGEDHLLRLALVIEAQAKKYSKEKIINLFKKAYDFNKKTTSQQVLHELRKIKKDGMNPWKCDTIIKHHGCCYGKEKCKKYREELRQQQKKIQIPDSEYSISLSRRGGLILLDGDNEAHSKIKDTNKYKKAISKEINIPLKSFEKAIAEATLLPSSLEGDDKRNPGAVIFELTSLNSEALFKDQLGETYITYIEQMNIQGVLDTTDTRFPIVNLSSPNILSNNPEKKILAQQSNKGDSSVRSVQNVLKTIRIRSREFDQWAASLYYMETEKAPSNEAIKAAVLVLESEAKDEREMYNRIASDKKGGIWWDMADKYGRAIHITKEGWEIVSNPPQIFKRYPHQLPLVEPAEVGSLTPLLDYVILEDPLDQLLNVVTPITYIIPDVPHVIEFLGGPQGVTKSTAHRFRRMVVDPSSIPLLSMPKDDLNQMIQHGDHHYLLMYDNVSAIDDEQSDLICRMCTGLGFQKRMLYTDDDTVIRQYIRCININGITLPGEKGDLLNRAVIQTASFLPDKNRRTEKEMKKKMSEDAPKVVRGFLDVLVRAMRLYDEVKPKRNNRMADFTRWGCAITQAMGIDHKHFEVAYANNIATQHEEAVKSNPVAEWLVRWFDYNNFESGYEGSAADILSVLLVYAQNLHNRDLNRVDGWPRGTTPFGKQLTRAIPDLNAIGYEVKYRKSGSRKYSINRIIRDKTDNTTSGQRALFFDGKKTDWLTTENLRDKLLVIATLDREVEVADIEATALIEEVEGTTPVMEEKKGEKDSVVLTEETQDEVAQEDVDSSEFTEETGEQLQSDRVVDEKKQPFSEKFSSIKKPKDLKELLDVLRTDFNGKTFNKEDYIKEIRAVMKCTEEAALKLWGLIISEESNYLVEVKRGEYQHKQVLSDKKETSSGTLAGWEKDILDRAEQVFTRDTTELGNLLFEKYIRDRFGVEEPLGKIIEILQKDPEKRFIVRKRSIGIRKGGEQNA